MDRRVGWFLPVLILVVACQVPLAPKGTPETRSTFPAVAPTKVGAGPSTGNGQYHKLQKPSEAHQILRGTIAVDAAYMVAGGGGNLIGSDGASIVAAGGGSLIGQGGSTLIGQGGSTAIADRGGTIVAAGAGNVVVGDADSAPVDGALAAVGAGGNFRAAGAVSAGGATTPLGLRQLSQVPGTPVAGTQLPAVGMLVSVVSLRSGHYLPLGLNERGRPVYTVYSNAAGEYELYIPASEGGNVLVVTNAPRAEDPRLLYNLITPVSDSSTKALDESTVLVTKLLRRLMAKRLATLLVQDMQEQTNLSSDELIFLKLSGNIVCRMNRALVRSRVRDLTAVEQERLSERLAEIALGFLDLSAVKSALPERLNQPEFGCLPFAPGRPALATLVDLFREFAAAAKDNMVLTNRIVEEVRTHALQNSDLHDETALQHPYPILKPSDVGVFLVDALAVDHVDLKTPYIDQLIGGLLASPARAPGLRCDILSAGQGMTLSLGLRMIEKGPTSTTTLPGEGDPGYALQQALLQTIGEVLPVGTAPAPTTPCWDGLSSPTPAP